MFQEDVAKVLLHGLAALRKEVEAYPGEAALWRAVPGLANPGGNLALHLAGNLQHFIGGELGHSGYVRDRDREFSVRDLPRAQVLAEIDAAAAAVEKALADLDPAVLETVFPLPLGGQRLGTRQFLIHLCGHLNYHLGQVNCHRRVVTGS